MDAASKATRQKKRKVLVQKSNNITKPDLRRVARRGGCQRLANTIYSEARSALVDFLERTVGDVAVYAENAKRKTAIPDDVFLSLRRQGKLVYGGSARKK